MLHLSVLSTGGKIKTGERLRQQPPNSVSTVWKYDRFAFYGNRSFESTRTTTKKCISKYVVFYGSPKKMWWRSTRRTTICRELQIKESDAPNMCVSFLVSVTVYCFFVLLLLFSVTNNFTVILSTLQRMIEFTVTTRNIAAFFNSSLVRMLSRRRTCDNDFWHVVGANTLLAPFLSTSIFVKRISYGFQFFLDDSILTTRWQHTWQLTIYFLSFYFWLYQFM